MRIAPEELHRLMSEVFQAAGCRKEDAETAAGVLLKADLRGIESHGSARFQGYIRLIKAGRVKPQATGVVEHESPSTARFNAEEGLGLVMAQKAMRLAMEKARTAGTGWVAVTNSTHFGIAGAHAELALEEDMIGFAFTNASPLVAPAGGVEPLLGTNPICCIIPTGKQPIIIDMATTVVANGKLEVADRKGERLPQGWVQTNDGLPSDNPLELKQGGTMLPLGGDLMHSSYKGYALGGMVDILSGVLSGANFGPWVPPFVPFLGVNQEQVGRGIGHFVGAMRVDAFRPAEEFKASMDQWVARMRKSKTAPGIEHVRIPGDPELEEEARRRAEGIPLHEKVVAELRKLAEEFGMSYERGEL